MGKVTVLPHEEIRSELVRLYPTAEQQAILCDMQEEVMAVTNHIIRCRKDVSRARAAYALRHGLVGPAPVFPQKPELPKPNTEDSKAEVKAVWTEYRKVEKEVSTAYYAWLKIVDKLVEGIPELAWRQDDYKALKAMYGKLKGTSVLYRDTVIRVKAIKRANFKKHASECPLDFRNSEPIWAGSFYGNRRGKPFYNASVQIPGLGSRILGRLRRPLPGRVIQGVTLTLKADGWYAAVKCIVPKRQLPEPVLGPIGVDVGQIDLVALSDGYKEANSRDAEFVSTKAALQEKGDRSGDANIQQRCRKQVARLDQSRKRRIVHWINSELLPKLEKHAIVFMEKLAKGFKSDRGPLSCMHMILSAVKQRLGDLDAKGKLGPKSRVVEVDPKHTSQTCSACRNVDKFARSGKVYACTGPECSLVLDADVNAARNILRRGMEMLRAA